MNSILNDFEVSEFTLDNGLRVLIREDHSAPVVAIFTHVLAGYFDEPDEWVGISHVLEHMYFKGTPTRGPGEIAQATKSAGGYLNASTIYDHTSYYTVLPSGELAQGLEIQSDALLHSLIDEEELRKELLVIIQEAKRKLDNPGAFARESLYAMMFDEHRMRRWRIGVEEQLRDFRRSDVAAFFERFYRAGAILLVIAGDVDTAQARALVQQKYGALRTGEPPRDRGKAEPQHADFRWRELAGDVAQSRIEMGWHTVPTLHDDTPALDVLALVLGQGRASWLYRNVRDAGLASGISSYNYSPTELGVFGITAESEPEDTRTCLLKIAATLEQIQDGDVSDADVQRAQNILEARVLRGLETMEGQASFLAEWQALGDWRMSEQYMEQVMATTRADVVRVARQYLAIGSAAILIYRPNSAAPLTMSAEELKQHAS